MENIRFILASASPRRHELLSSVGIPHEVLVTDADENPAGMPEKDETYAEYFAREASRLKCEAAISALRGKTDVKTVVIAADTVVSPDGSVIFGKPKSAAHAAEMLRTLSGSTHAVSGGITVAVIDGEDVRTVSRALSTYVTFKELTDNEIDAYVASDEPDGKAGAYAIQGLGGAFVTEIKGDYPNVVGISVYETLRILGEDFGIRLTEKVRHQLSL